MRKFLKCQSGYALVLILLTIALMGIFMPIIYSNLTNSVSQFQRVEEVNQLNKLEQMGFLYINKTLDQAAKEAKNEIEIWLQETSSSQTNQEIMSAYLNFFKTALPKYNLALNAEPLTLEMEEAMQDWAIQLSIDRIVQDSSAIEGEGVLATTIKVEYTVLPSLDGVFNASKAVVTDRTLTIRIQDS